MTTRLPLLVLVALSLALAGCTSPEESATPPPASPTGGGTTPTTATPTPTTPTQTTPIGGGTGGNDTSNGTSDRSLLNESFETGFVGWTNNTDAEGAAGDGNWTFNVTTEDAHHGESSLRIAFEGGQPSGAAWISREVQTPGANGGAGNGTGGDTNATGNGTGSAGGSSAGMALNLSVWIRSASSGGAGNLSGDENTGLGNDSAGTFVLLWIGTTEPTAASQFDASNGANAHSGVRIPLRQQSSGVGGTGVGGASGGDGWELYTLEWATPVPEDGLLYVAVGILVEGDGGTTGDITSGESGAAFHLDHLMLEFDSMS